MRDRDFIARYIAMAPGEKTPTKASARRERRQATPQLELFVIYFVMAMVLAFRPRGLFSLAEPRKI